MKTIEENNKLIAEFMGLKVITVDELKSYLAENRANGLIHTPNSNVVNDLTYHESFDKLIPVVNKCREAQVFGSQNLIDDIDFSLTGVIEIEWVYKTVVAFIEAHNERKELKKKVNDPNTNHYGNDVGYHNPIMSKFLLNLINEHSNVKFEDACWHNDACDSIEYHIIEGEKFVKIFLPNAMMLNPDQECWSGFCVQDENQNELLDTEIFTELIEFINKNYTNG